MSPLKSQVSFSKDRSFALLRRSESARKEGKTEEELKVEKKKSKKKDKIKEEKIKEEKDSDKKDNGEKKDGRWTRLRKSDAQKAKDSDDTDREGSREQESIFLRRKDSRRAKDRSKERKEKDSNSTLTNSLAISLAATLSPFSSFVSSHSPRGSRKGSPNRKGASSPPSPSPSANFFSSSKPNERPLSFTAPWDRRRERKNSRHSRSPNSTLRVRHSWGAPGSSSPSMVSSHSPTPSPAASSPSLSPTTSQSESSSVSEDEGLGGVRPKSNGRTGIRPKIRISSAENSKESSPPPPLPSKPPPCIYPYRIEEGWELFHSTDTVAKHRKTCQSCRCTRELHDVYHEDWVNVRERLGLGDSLGRSSRERCLEEGYSWVPPGLSSEQIYDYMSCLPGHKVPRLGTPGEKYRERQLMLQLPKQDLALAFTRHVELQYHTSFKDFITARNDIALDIGIVKPHIPHESECRGCGGTLPKGAVAVVAPRLGDEANYHPACYTCSTCKEFLVDLVYCVWGDSLQCGRHYAEKLKPRCAACDELIFSGEYTKAMSKDWHSGHFCCWQCDESLTGQRYVLKDEHPYCIKCYEAVFANTCEDCSLIIGIDSKDLSYKDKHWHEKCFLCNKCQVSLVDKQFGSKMERIYCGPCYDAQFATRCDGCGEIFRAGNKKMEYKQRQWHEKCFACCVCKTPIGTKSFIPKDQDIYCAGCYEEKFATRCVKCDKIITSGGVTYKSEPWHRECFTCTHCNTSLAGQRFTSKDDKPYCADCFGELFAKRCTACTKPITGIGGTRFISFEDRHWHNDCFICAVCNGSLVGKGFITDGADILCPECAKQKLM